MTTMLDKCAVAGDITQGIDRRGVWTAAITVIGGTSGTAVKLVSSDTVNGGYTDYKTLISAADAETDQYKGFVVDLHGAKKFIKVTGAVMATAVFGDCDHDVKTIAITEGEVPSGADLEDNKAVSITENGVVEITPTAGKDGMKKVTATVNVSGGGGDVPTEWYLWQDKHGDYKYLPFATAPDTLVDSMQYITIGSSFIRNNTFLSTIKVTTYTKISDSSFSIGRASYDRITEDVPIGGGASFFEEISLNTDNPTYNKTLTKGASIYLNKYVNMLVGRGDVTDTVKSIGIDFATITYVDSTQVLTVALNTSHPEASTGVAFKVWGE